MSKKEDNLKKIEAEKEEYLNSWKRERANFINYKNREDERLQDVLFFAKEAMFERLISVLDNIGLAEKSIKPEMKEDSNIQGFILIKHQLEDALKMEGLEEIECKGIFDPAMHEVVEQIERQGESGEIIEVLQKGYKFLDRVIRPAKVKIIK